MAQVRTGEDNDDEEFCVEDGRSPTSNKSMVSTSNTLVEG